MMHEAFLQPYLVDLVYELYRACKFLVEHICRIEDLSGSKFYPEAQHL